MEKEKVFPIVVEEVKEKILEQAHDDEIQMNAHVAVIEKEGKEFSITSIEELSKKSADGWIINVLSKSLKQLKERFEGIIGSNDTISEYEKKYTTIQDRTKDHADAIRYLLEKYEGLWRKGNDGFYLDGKLLEKKATKESEWQPTSEQADYFSLLKSVQKALDDVRQFEKKQGWQPAMIFGETGATLFGADYENGWKMPENIRLSATGFQKHVFWGSLCKPILSPEIDED